MESERLWPLAVEDEVGTWGMAYVGLVVAAMTVFAVVLASQEWLYRRARLGAEQRSPRLTGTGAPAVEGPREPAPEAPQPEPIRATAFTGSYCLHFDPALTGADSDLAAVAERVKRAPAETLSLCLYGPAGSGKSAYARYLAAALQLEAMEKSLADLVAAEVEQTQRNLARAYEEARRRRAMLIFDAPESLLRSHSGAPMAGMFRLAEDHPLPYVLAVRVAEDQEFPGLREFALRVRLQPMTPSQAATAFRRTFGVEPPAGLKHVAPLTPGDFVAAARKAEMLREHDPQALLELLAQEIALKQDVPVHGTFPARALG